MTERKALKLALEALTNAYWPTESDLMPAHNIKECAEAITAIKQALAQPEQEPVSKLQEATAERAWFTIAELNAWADKKLSENPHWVMPKDEPERDEPPPQRKPLRDHEIAKILDRERMKWHKSPPTYEFDLAFARAIEAAHGIKGEA
jgi:hypothetical protein